MEALEQSRREPHWLIVEDDEACARSLHRLIGLDQPATLAFSAGHARAALSTQQRYRGVLIDLRLGDESGLDVLGWVRQRDPCVPAAIVTGELDRHVINRAFSLGAAFLCKPVAGSEVMAFVSRCIAAAKRLPPGPSAFVEHLARQHDLSRRELEVLVHVVSGSNRAEVQRSMGISENTFKSHTRKLLRKLQAGDLSEVTIQVLRAAFDS